MEQVKEMLDVHKYYDPNRPIEPKVKRDWKKKYVDHYILEMPGPAILEDDNLKPGITYAFDYIDDNYLMFDRSLNKKDYLYWGGGVLGAYIFLIWPFFPIEENTLIWPLWVTTILFLPFSVWMFVLYFKVIEERKVIFDRQRGLVQMPGTFWQRPQLIRFDELHVVLALMSRFSGGILLMATLNRTFSDRYLAGGGVMLPFGFANAWQSWSFWVWYMDKNRPLPFGEALDPYRERDYERRRAEGFPEPLYVSRIETPEYFTDEYQRLNEKNRHVKGSANMSIFDREMVRSKKGSENYYSSSPN